MASLHGAQADGARHLGGFGVRVGRGRVARSAAGGRGARIAAPGAYLARARKGERRGARKERRTQRGTRRDARRGRRTAVEQAAFCAAGACAAAAQVCGHAPPAVAVVVDAGAPRRAALAGRRLGARVDRTHAVGRRQPHPLYAARVRVGEHGQRARGRAGADRTPVPPAAPPAHHYPAVRRGDGRRHAARARHAVRAAGVRRPRRDRLYQRRDARI